MLTFRRIRYRNILSVGNNFIEVDFQKSSRTLITGTNGVGKSTLNEALTFVLYGRPYRKINKPTLVNSINQKHLLVEIEFSVGQKNYTVRRGIKPNLFEIYEDDFLLNQDSTARDYQEVLENEILKMNYKTFIQIVIIGSASHIPFMQLAAQQRRDVIENILDLEIFSVMNSILKERVQTNKSDIIQIKYDIDLSNEKIRLHEEYMKSLKQNNQKLIFDNKQKIEDTKKEIEAYNKDKFNLIVSIEEKYVTISDKEVLNTKITEILKLEKELENKLSKLKKEVKFYNENDNCPSCKQSIAHEFKHETINKKDASIKEVEDGLVSLSKTVEKFYKRRDKVIEIQKQIDALEGSVSLINSKIQSLEHFVKKVEEEVDKLVEAVIIDNEDEVKFETLKKQIKSLEKRREQLSKEKSVLDTAGVLLKDGGIKSKIIKQYVPIINKLVNKYLSIFDLFLQFELDENFNEVIRARHKDEYSYENFSEGEKLKIDLSLLATWRAIGKIRSNSTVNLLLLDEIMDSSLDNDGIDNMFTLLESFKEGTNIFVISHRENIADKFENVLRLEKVKNFTQIME